MPRMAGENLDSTSIHKIVPWGRKFAHHVRISSPEEVDQELFGLLRKAHAYSLT
jgi:hypothetical protein